MTINIKFLAVILMLTFSFSAAGQKKSGWTKKQLKNFDSYLHDFNESNKFCDCLFESITSQFSAKQVNKTENDDLLKKFISDCQMLTKTFPTQKMDPELHFAAVRVEDEKMKEENNLIRYDSKGKIYITISNYPDIKNTNESGDLDDDIDKTAYGPVFNIENNITGLIIENTKTDLESLPWGEEIEIVIEYVTDTNLKTMGSIDLPMSIQTHNKNSKDNNIFKPYVKGFKRSYINLDKRLERIDDHSYALLITPSISDFSGDAEDVKISWEATAGMNITNSVKSVSYSYFESGKTQPTINIPWKQQLDEPIQKIDVTIESKYGEPRVVSYEFDKDMRSSESSDYFAEATFSDFGQTSDVDELPKIKKIRPYKNAIGFVIGIEEYKYRNEGIANVKYAMKDSKIMRNYFEGVFGIPKDQIFYLNNDPTVTDINKKLNTINNLKRVLKKELNRTDIDIFFYYAGHGTGNKSKSPVLVPYDVSLSSIESAPRRDEDILNSLAKNTDGRVIAFMDACYASESFETHHRGIGVVKEEGEISPNVVIFNAVSGENDAFPNNDEGHGAFTYELLSILKSSKGDIKLKDLFDQLDINLTRTTTLKIGLTQEPSVISKAKWESWNLLED